MDIRSGKTIRRFYQHILGDPLLKVTCNEKETSVLFGYEFHQNIEYSMKKKKRWELRSMLCKDGYEEDTPIMYVRHQCAAGRGHLNDVYLYDSITEKELGNMFVSDRHYEKGSFNGKSAKYQIENRLNYTNKEKEAFEKLKNMPRKKIKNYRNSHRALPLVIPETSDKLPERKEYITERLERHSCIHVDELMNVNDISNVNRISPVHSIHRDMSKKDIVRMKRNEKDRLKSMSLDYDCNEEDEIEQLSSVEETKKPFVLTTEDFISKKKVKAPKRRDKRKRQSPKIPLIEKDKPAFIEPDVSPDNNFIDLHEDLLPCVDIESTICDFIEDVRVVMNFCQCRLSDSYPPTILIDMDDSVDLRKKSFLVIKSFPLFRENKMAMKVIFNISEQSIDFNDVLDQNFTSIKSVVVFVQSRLEQSESVRYCSSRNMIMLDGKVDGMTNLWKTKKSDSQIPLHLEHQEWHDNKLNETKLNGIFSVVTPEFGECTVCFTDVSNLDMIMMESCGHIICEKCISSHIVFRLESGMKYMTCPGTECDVMLDASIILSVVSWKRYCKRIAILESHVITQGGCPCSFCGAVLMHESGLPTDAIKRVEYKCVCGNKVCSRCGQMRHFPSTCNEMRKHKMKMSQLNDYNIMPARIKPLIYRGRSCPKCFAFVVKEGGCNHLSCSCGDHFCWGCGDSINAGLHVTHGFPCTKVSDLVSYDLTKQSLTPDPSSIRPRLYCTALHHQIINNSYVSINFYKRFQSILQRSYSPCETASILEQMSELSVVIESIFVKAYQISKRAQMNTFRYIKCSVALFLFYQHRIWELVDSVDINTRSGNRRVCGDKTLRKITEKLSELIKEVQAHLHRFARSIDP